MKSLCTLIVGLLIAAAVPAAAIAQTVYRPGGIATPMPTPVPVPIPMPTPVPNLSTPSLRLPSTPSLPQAAPPIAQPPAVALPRAATAPKGRCTLPSQQQWCRIERASADGGGDDSNCDCRRDICTDERRPDGTWLRRVCQKR